VNKYFKASRDRTRKATLNGVTKRADDHRTRREGDEMACSCGARWPSWEAHPK